MPRIVGDPNLCAAVALAMRGVAGDAIQSQKSTEFRPRLWQTSRTPDERDHAIYQTKRPCLGRNCRNSRREVNYQFSWPLGDIISAVARAGLRIESLAEYPSQAQYRFKEQLDQARFLPGECRLIARKEPSLTDVASEAFDLFLLAGRHTLLGQGASEFLALFREHGIGISALNRQFETRRN